MVRIEDVLVGSDPEVFLKSKKTGKYMSAIGRVGGTKTEPRKLSHGIYVQEDNVLAEFNIPPSKTKQEFKLNINKGLELLQKEVEDFADIAIDPYAFFDETELNNPTARNFGCSPDLSCWTLETNIPPEAEDLTLRTAGAHVLVGYKNPDLKISQKLGQAFDLFMGVPSVKISRNEQPRKELYGKMGAIRFKPFGVEYRTLSNFWLTSGDRIDWVYEQVMRSVEFVKYRKTIDREDFDIMEMAINDNLIKAAEHLITKHKLNLVA